jgi:hypothetical protein
MAVGFPTKTTYANGDVFSADDINSTNGTINLLQTSTLSSQAGKNGVINGGFDIWQRGTSFTATSVYTADRWYTSTNTGQTITRQTTSDTTNLPFIQYCARAQRNNGTTNTNALGISQSFETVNSLPFAGRSVTLSFYARKGANLSGTFTAVIFSGTGTDQPRNFTATYTGEATVATSSPTLTTTWARYTVTGTVAATATELSVLIYFVPSGTAGAADYFEVTGVQIELGSYATTFSRASGTIQGELALCQRYFCKTFPLTTTPASAAGQAGSAFGNRAYGAQTAVYVFYWQFPVSMRATPTITTYSPSAAGSAWFDEDGAAKTAAVGSSSNNATTIYNSAAATPNKLALIHATAEIEL